MALLKRTDSLRNSKLLHLLLLLAVGKSDEEKQETLAVLYI
jgi:hypothetical protein